MVSVKYVHDLAKSLGIHYILSVIITPSHFIIGSHEEQGQSRKDNEGTGRTFSLATDF